MKMELCTRSLLDSSELIFIPCNLLGKYSTSVGQKFCGYVCDWKPNLETMNYFPLSCFFAL